MNEGHGHLLFTDGSSLGNPGPGGWAAIVILKGKRQKAKTGSTDEVRVIEIGGGEKHTTNNRMELTALIKGLERLKEESGDISIYIDSSYVHKGATQWLHAWVKNDWKTKGKKDVGNRDLWEMLLPLLGDRKKFGKITWKHIPGHSGLAGNERADMIATGFARLRADTRGQAKGDEVELFEGYLGDYTVDILNTTIDKKIALKRSASRAHSRAKAYSYLSLIDGKVMRHTTWADCEKRVKGKAGARHKKALSPEDEKQILRQWGARL